MLVALDIPNLRHLRAIAAVARHGGISAAVDDLHVTQPAVTQAIQTVERRLGVALFARSQSGMAPTAFGRLLAARVERAEQEFRRAEADLRALARGGGRPAANLERRVTLRQLAALSAVADTHSFTYAAKRLNVSQPAVHRAVREFERVAGVALFARTGASLAPSEAGEALIRRAKLALNELRQALDDIAAEAGSVTGRIVVGTLPLSRTLLVPRAVIAVRRLHPALRVALVDGPYDTLLAGLRCGDIDVIAGALRLPPPVDDVVEEPLFDDPYAVVARAGHPLICGGPVTVRALAEADWVVARQGTPLRSQFEELFSGAGLTPPCTVVESSSLAAARGLLAESDMLALISRHQIHYEESAGLLGRVPIELPGMSRRIGLAMRAEHCPTRGLAAMLDSLRVVAGQLDAASLTGGDGSASRPA